MLTKSIFLATTLALAIHGADKQPPAGQAANDSAVIAAKLYNGKDAVRDVLGSDLGGYIVVVEATVTPMSKEPLSIHPDDFLLRSDKDGQRSRPFAPSQIAGRGALVISDGGGGRAVMADNNGPIWGGYPTGRPGRLGGDGAVMGNTSSTVSEGMIHDGSKDKEDPLMGTLKARALPETKADKQVSGLLYFLMEGKHKDKQLELLYTGPAGRLSVRFKN